MNLLVKDLILKLGLLIKCTPTGLAVCQQPEELAFPLLSELVYVFSWHVQGVGLGDVLAWARDRVPPTATVMTQQTLHCITYVTTDPADPIGDQFLCSPVQWLDLTHLFWSGQTCFLLVSLKVTQEPYFQVPDSYPRISLTKAPADKWQSQVLEAAIYQFLVFTKHVTGLETERMCSTPHPQDFSGRLSPFVKSLENPQRM